MKTHALALGLRGGAARRPAPATSRRQRQRRARRAQTPKAQKAAGTKTIAAGLAPNSRSWPRPRRPASTRRSPGPGPYTVFVPDDAAFDAAPGGHVRRRRPRTAPQLTGVLTNLILPGTVLVADIDKAIDNGKGKAVLATMGGGTLTATKDGGKTVLTDAAGHKATITQGDEQYHQRRRPPHRRGADAEQGRRTAPAVGQKAGK